MSRILNTNRKWTRCSHLLQFTGRRIFSQCSCISSLCCFSFCSAFIGAFHRKHIITRSGYTDSNDSEISNTLAKKYNVTHVTYYGVIKLIWIKHPYILNACDIRLFEWHGWNPVQIIYDCLFLIWEQHILMNII